MKRNLGIFGNSVALAAGLNWTVQPNDEAAGGRVLLMRESYGNRPEIQHELVVRAAAEGNSPIDFLHCVPPSDVSSSDGRRASRLGLALCSNGYQIWDGVDPMARHDFARSVEQFRIVQYDSCRGLEGWVVVLDLFDEFLAYKRTHFLARAGKSESGALQSPEDYARQQAWRWAMIALSRPIDTLVLSFRDPESEVGRLFWSLANKHGDFAQVVG